MNCQISGCAITSYSSDSMIASVLTCYSGFIDKMHHMLYRIDELSGHYGTLCDDAHYLQINFPALVPTSRSPIYILPCIMLVESVVILSFHTNAAWSDMISSEIML